MPLFRGDIYAVCDKQTGDGLLLLFFTFPRQASKKAGRPIPQINYFAVRISTWDPSLPTLATLPSTQPTDDTSS